MYIWIDVAQTITKNTYLCLTNSAMKCHNLSVYIRCSHTISIKQSNTSYTTSAQHLGSHPPYSTYTYHKHMALGKLPHTFLTKKYHSTLLPRRNILYHISYFY